VEEVPVDGYQAGYRIVEDFPVLRTHPKSQERKQFISGKACERGAHWSAALCGDLSY
jgi:hypothetical protein